MISEQYGKIQETLHHLSLIDEHAKAVRLLLNEIMAEYDAREDVAEYKRTLFRVVENDVMPFPFRLQSKTPDFGESSEVEQGFVEFTEKEIKQMPKKLQRILLIHKKRCHIRLRDRGNSRTYEIRFRAEGYNVTASGITKEIARARMLEKLRKAKPTEKEEQQTIPQTFHSFAMYYFEKFRKERITPKTYKSDMHRYTKYLQPRFKDIQLKKITPSTCKDILDTVLAQGHSKTAQELYSLMSIIFKGAIAHGIIERNPMATVPCVQHECESGEALSREEEKILLDGITEPDYKRAIAIALYTGLRPNELETARIEGEFIVAKNSKRKRGKIEYKKIPIIARLRPFLKDGIGTLPPPQLIRRRINAVLPNHKLYDLRTTFYTRCDELGVAEPARDEFVGHSAGALTNAYRDLSNAYLLKEGKKLDLW